MNLIRLCVARPVGVAVCVLLVLLFGVLALTSMPVQLTPNVDTPVITIGTQWLGANPQEVEREIIERQEEQLRGVKGLQKMTSTASDSSAEIRLEFYPDIDKSAALQDVIDKLNRVGSYPLDMDEPTISVADSARDSEIAWLQLRPTADFDGDISTLRDFAIDYIKPELDRIEGVGSTDVYGGREREVRVDVDPGTLAARGLTLTQVRNALLGQNANISAGTRTQGKRDFAVRTVGQYESLDAIRNTVIAYNGEAPVYVRDVATVTSSYKRRGSFVRSRGAFTLAFPVRREVGKNVMQVMEGVRAAVTKINEEILASRGLSLVMDQSYDETIYITQSIETVKNNIIFGGTLAGIVLMLFLRNLRATAVVVLSIPISVVGTFLVVALLGRTVNVISLAGMAFAVGMVVDSAVVVLENIYRHRQLGRSVLDATLAGTREVWGAVLASTLTTIAVFIPVIFIREEAGQLFQDISLATVAAVSLSLLVALTVIPVLASRLLSGTAPKAQPERSILGNVFAGVTGWLAAGMFRKLAVVLVMVVGSLGAIPFLVPPTTYLPSGNRNLIFGGLSAPPGYALDEFERMGDVVEAYLGPYWEAEPGSPEAEKLASAWTERITPLVEAGVLPGTEPLPDDDGFMSWARIDRWLERLRVDRTRREWLTPPPPIENFFFVAFGTTCFMGATSADDARVAPLTRLMSRSIEDLPGIFGGFSQSSLFRFGGGNDVTVEVRGDDIAKVRSAAEVLQMRIMTSPQLGTFPMATPANFALGRPELRIEPDRERAADVGLDVREIGQAVEASVDGSYVGDYRTDDDKRIDIALYIAGQRERDLQSIGDIPLFTPIGRIVPLASVAKMVDTTAPDQIIRIERQRAVSLSVRPPEAMALEQAVAEIRRIEAEARQQGMIDSSISLAMTGNADKLTTARTTMVGAWDGWTTTSLYNIVTSRFFLSVLVIYLLMAALYESWIIPLVIMFSVPVALFGGFLGLSIAHVGTLLSTSEPVQQLDVLTFLGFVILVGIVVNNAILLVNQALVHLREHGMQPTEAIREAVRVRVRPVFMTTLTTFVGQLPLALMSGAGTELYRGLASVMLGGLLIGTLGTLILVPCVLSIIFSLPGMQRRLASDTRTATLDDVGRTHPVTTREHVEV